MTWDIIAQKCNENGRNGGGGITRESPTLGTEGRGALLCVSGTAWAFPGRCSMVKSNSAIEMHQGASFDCLGDIDVNHCKFV